MKYLINFAIVYILIFGKIFAQSQSILIIGYIYDIDEAPVEGVHVKLENSALVTTSNDKGLFQLRIVNINKPQEIILSHIAYQSQSIKITKKDLQNFSENDIYTLKIMLYPDIKELPIASIEDAKIQLAYKNKKTWILDYELGNGELILLAIEKNNKVLRIVNENNQNTSIERNVSRHCTNLHKDCLNSLHLIGKDSAYQAFYSDSVIIIPYTIPIQDFYKFINPCQISTDKILVLRELFDFNQTVKYIVIDKEKDEERTLAGITNEEQKSFNESFFGDLYASHSQYKQVIENEEFIEEKFNQTLSIKREIMTSGHFFSTILCKPTYHPLLSINDVVYLFNHYDGEIIAYNDDFEILSKVVIDYQKDKDWANEIIVNEERTRCFAKYSRQGQVSLHEIDLQTGKIKEIFPIEQHIFPEKIRVKGNYIYYMFKEELFRNENKRYLWRQNIL